MPDLADGRRQPHLDPTLAAFLHQHRDDLPGRAVAEELPERLLVPGDAVALDQREEIPLGIAAERRLGEMRVLGEEVLRPRPGVGEVAAPAARDEDLLAGFSAWSITRTRAPACPAVAAAISPAPPAPRTIAS
jgi:hypothetical protein